MPPTDHDDQDRLGGDPAALQQAAEEVAAERVGAEQVRPRPGSAGRR